MLIDLWAKLEKPRAVYSDLTRVGFVGKTVPPANYAEIFTDRGRARDAAIDRSAPPSPPSRPISRAGKSTRRPAT